MLFEEFKYFNYQFPEPQYLGAKHTHLVWINKFIPRNVVTAIDAFAGSQTVAFLLKRIGLQVITNDFLCFNHQIGLALIENEGQKLTQADLNLLMANSPVKERFHLIEHIFKSHPTVLPTVGQIKNVDFFINDIPFGLKVTYLPAEYIKEKRKEKGFPVEVTFLKQKAAEAEIIFDKKAKPIDIQYEFVEKMKDKGDDFCQKVLNQLREESLQILWEAQSNSKILSKWLYENQGEMRFGSENRLFLVLVDTEEFRNSWKLKRNLDLLKPSIQNYLDNFGNKKIDDLKITFGYRGKTQTFNALADVIFVVR